MKIMVSACLLGENCKYNGENNYNENVLAFVQGHDQFDDITMLCLRMN